MPNPLAGGATSSQPEFDRPPLQVVREFSRAGGVESVAYELHAIWRRSGTAARVLSSLAPEIEEEEVIRVAPWLRWIAARGPGRYLGRMIVVPVFTLAATRRLRRFSKTHVILSHGDTLTGDVCVIHAVNKASLREKERSGGWKWRLNPMHLWVSVRDRRVLGGLQFKHYVAVSSQVRTDLEDLYNVPRNRITIIPNGVNLARFNQDISDRQETRAAFRIPAEAPLVLFVGHEFERKGLSFVIDALSRIRTDAFLLVVGSDTAAPYRRQAEQRGVAERVIFAGHRSDLPALYRAADIFVLPTYYESYALVCMEALACGVPVLATRVGGTEDYLTEGVNGFFVTRDADDIASKLTAVLDDPILHAKLKQEALKTARHYSWETIAERYAALLNRIAKE